MLKQKDRSQERHSIHHLKSREYSMKKDTSRKKERQQLLIPSTTTAYESNRRDTQKKIETSQFTLYRESTSPVPSKAQTNPTIPIYFRKINYSPFQQSLRTQMLEAFGKEFIQLKQQLQSLSSKKQQLSTQKYAQSHFYARQDQENPQSNDKQDGLQQENLQQVQSDLTNGYVYKRISVQASLKQEPEEEEGHVRFQVQQEDGPRMNAGRYDSKPQDRQASSTPHPQPHNQPYQPLASNLHSMPSNPYFNSLQLSPPSKEFIRSSSSQFHHPSLIIPSNLQKDPQQLSLISDYNISREQANKNCDKAIDRLFYQLGQSRKVVVWNKMVFLQEGGGR